MALFISTSTHRIDKKGRVSVPAAFRAALEGESFRGVVLSPPLRELPCIEGAGMSRFEAIASSLDDMHPLSEARDALATNLLATATPIAFDGEGRIVLGEALIARAQLSDEALFAGLGKKFQIWRPDLYAARQAETRPMALDNVERLPWGGSVSGEPTREPSQ